jgi:hypothetical protein
VSTQRVPLSRRAGWFNRIAPRLDALSADGRALVDLTEANRTPEELDALQAVCAERGLALLVRLAAAQGGLGRRRGAGAGGPPVRWIASRRWLDTYLSVSGPAQLALPALVAGGSASWSRCARALARLAAGAPFDALPAEGGWRAVVRAGEALDEE